MAVAVIPVVVGIVLVVVTVVVVVVDINIVLFFGLQACPGGDIYRKPGTLSDWNSQVEWTRLGPLGCEGKDAENPHEDVAESWGFCLSDETLLASATGGTNTSD